MFQLEESKYLYLLLIVPIVVVFFVFNFYWKTQKQKEFGDLDLVKKLIPEYSGFKSILKFLFVVLGLSAVIIALANPRLGTKMETIKRDGIDIVFALDVSKSMLAEDVAPNRLEKSKQIINQIINNLQGDRIGLIAYAGSAYPILPMTSDYSIGKMYLQNANTNMLSSQGTALNQAINQAINFFDDDQQSKLLILISDGEDHGDDSKEALEIAKEKGIKIVTISVGTTKGGQIPIKENGKILGYKKDSNGETVITKMNPETLKLIAEATKGKYLDGNNTKSVVDNLQIVLSSIEKNESETQQIAEFKTQYQWFLGLGFLLLFIDLLMFERKTAWFQKLNLFKEKRDE
ncbi:VWA domain-containing protein [uncultured Flavobacterium sp.]|uniref:VWA domain-containing protein n=1 Tax=uncultured Flavobacterium sp. TaxID=165435 RepID=UPI0030EE7909|tara:strand:- start:31119 stop:32159 length:1041 start_codon:yes stop_codon:yes gene_type:complete